jgi:hypothetical protein
MYAIIFIINLKLLNFLIQKLGILNLPDLNLDGMVLEPKKCNTQPAGHHMHTPLH